MSPLRFFPRFVGLSLIVSCCAFIAGCTTFQLSGVTVSLVDIKPAASSLLESSAVLTVRYTNENVIPIGLDGSSHKVYFNGNYVGKAVSKQPLGLAALSSITQDVTVRFENVSLLQQLIAMRDRQIASYKVDSVLFVTSGEEKLDIKTSNSGSIDLRGLAAGK
jgi:LEA14-like dessication related protein